MNSLEIDYLPVGEESRSGDAIAIRFGDYENDKWTKQTIIIIDGGNTSSGEALVNHVKTVYKTNYVDRVILTHPDADHASGLRKVVEDLDIGKIWMHRPWNYWDEIKDSIIDGRITKKSFGNTLKEAYQYAYEIEQIAIKKKIDIWSPKQGGYYYEEGEESEKLLTVLGPGKELYKELIKTSQKTPEMTVKESIIKAEVSTEKKMAYEDMTFETEHLTEDDGETSSENNMSLVLYLNVAGVKVLFTGDAGTMGLYNAIRYAVANKIDLKDLNVVHVPHHGSRHNISKGILNSIHAEYAVVSCAKKGEPHHPSNIVTNAFIRRGIEVHATKGNAKNCRFGLVPMRAGQVPAIPVAFVNYVQIPDDES